MYHRAFSEPGAAAGPGAAARSDHRPYGLGQAGAAVEEGILEWLAHLRRLGASQADLQRWLTEAAAPMVAAIIEAFLAGKLDVYALWAVRDMPAPQVERAAQACIAGLASPDDHVRLRAADALRDVRSAAAVEPLLAALGDESPAVRVVAAETLGAYADPRGNDGFVRQRVGLALAARLAGQVGIDEQVACLYALCRSGCLEAVPSVAQCLRSGHAAVRQAAAAALAELAESCPPGAVMRRMGGDVAPVARLLKDSSLPVREQAARALGALGSPQAIPALRALCAERREGLRTRAGEALRRLGDGDTLPQAACA